MLPWKEFLDIRQRAFDELYDLHPPSDPALQLFSPALHFEELGYSTSGWIISSEEDLKKFHESMGEIPVGRAISALAAAQLHGKDWNFVQGMFFENHTNRLGEPAEDMQARLRIARHSNESHRPVDPIHADQLCVYKKNGELELLFVIEYKAPHKISKEILRAGLREMNVPEDIINRSSIPTDPSKKFQYNADKLVAAVVTQIYSYMLESGCEYSCIIAGDAIVFLWIKEDDSTLFTTIWRNPTSRCMRQMELGLSIRL